MENLIGPAEGRKVVVTTDMYSPTVGKGAVGVVTDSRSNGKRKYYEVALSGDRLFILTDEQVRLATDAEIAADAADPDLD